VSAKNGKLEAEGQTTRTVEPHYFAVAMPLLLVAW